MKARVWFAVFSAAVEAVAASRRSPMPEVMAGVNRNILCREVGTIEGEKASRVAGQIFDSLMAGARGEAT